MDNAAFIRTQTRLIAPSAVPELTLWLADEVTPLWHATEQWLDKHNCPPPYWAFAWAGGQAIARYLFDNPHMVAGKKVFDLACGGGVAAIAAKKCGAAYVVANDIDAMAIEALKLNAIYNEVLINADCGDRTGDALADYDIIIAGDIFYEKSMALRLHPWLQSLADVGKVVLVADPGRAYLPQGGFEKLASYTIPVSQDLESRKERESVVYRLLATTALGA